MADQDPDAGTLSELQELNAILAKMNAPALRSVALCFWVHEPEAAWRSVRSAREVFRGA